MDYPRRFYRKSRDKSKERQLKVKKESIKQCRWCGTFYLDSSGDKKWCSSWCHSMWLNIGDSVVLTKKR